MENYKTYRRPKWDDTFLVETVMRNEGWQSLIEYLCLTRCISAGTGWHGFHPADVVPLQSQTEG